MQIDPITAALGSTAASTTSVNGVNNFESYLNNAGNNSLASIFQKYRRYLWCLCFSSDRHGKAGIQFSGKCHFKIRSHGHHAANAFHCFLFWLYRPL